MSETDKETIDQAIDPPDNQGGGGSTALSLDSTTADPTAIDPPDNNGGTGAS